MTTTGRISVVAAMLNEAANVAGLVDDLSQQDFEGEVEIFVADGGSTDGSRELLHRAAEKAGLELTVVDNPQRIVSTGLNAVHCGCVAAT